MLISSISFLLFCFISSSGYHGHLCVTTCVTRQIEGKQKSKPKKGKKAEQGKNGSLHLQLALHFAITLQILQLHKGALKQDSGH